ncbi:hypothetical protein Tco_0561354 [Tanacetum coccineum]
MDDYVWDDDLWGPPNYQATEDTKYGIDGCTCAYCLTYDEEKESALNEQICIEVLSRLISQADTDMTELEEELFELLIQLAKTDEEFSDLFRVNLNMKINILKSSIMELKGNASNCLSTSREPAQSTYEILNSLFGYYSQEKNKVLEANPSSKKKEMGSSSNVNQTGKRKRVIITPLEEHTISQTIVKVKEENADYHCMSLVPKHTASSLRVASTCDMNREVNKVQLKSPIMTHDNVHITTDKGKSICQKPSLETQGKWKHQINRVKSQTEKPAPILIDLIEPVLCQPDEESTGSTSIRLEESSREPNAKKSVNSELGFPVCSSKSENHQEPSGSLSLTVYSPNTLKRRERPTSPYQKSSSSPLLLEGPKPCNGELGFPVCSSKSENHQEPSGSLSLTVYSPNTLKRRERPTSPCQKSSSSPLLLEGPKPLCTHETDVNNPHDMTPYTLVKLKAIAKRRGLKNCSKSENHQEPSGSLSLTVYSPNTLKRRERPTSPCQKSSSSPLLREGPKPLCTHETDVNNPHDMKPYTLVKLKAIAKSRGLKNYSKLNKSGLLELLGINVAEENSMLECSQKREKRALKRSDLKRFDSKEWKAFYYNAERRPEKRISSHFLMIFKIGLSYTLRGGDVYGVLCKSSLLASIYCNCTLLLFMFFKFACYTSIECAESIISVEVLIIRGCSGSTVEIPTPWDVMKMKRMDGKILDWQRNKFDCVGNKSSMVPVELGGSQRAQNLQLCIGSFLCFTDSNLRMASNAKEKMQSDSIYMVQNRKNVTKDWIAERKSGKVTTNVYSKRIRFLSEVAGKPSSSLNQPVKNSDKRAIKIDEDVGNLQNLVAEKECPFQELKCKRAYTRFSKERWSQITRNKCVLFKERASLRD